MIFFTVFEAPSIEDAVNQMDWATRDWEMKAARGECGWVCSDCCTSFRDGMPDECVHGIRSCAEIIQNDKMAAQAEIAKATGNTA